MVNNNIPGWAPRAPMVVMDDTKMSFFAKAAAIRAGVRGSSGALQGLGEAGRDFVFGEELIEGDLWADAENTKMPGSNQSVASFGEKLSAAVQRITGNRVDDTAAVTVATKPRHVMVWWHWALIAVGAVGVVVVAKKALK